MHFSGLPLQLKIEAFQCGIKYCQICVEHHSPDETNRHLPGWHHVSPTPQWLPRSSHKPMHSILLWLCSSHLKQSYHSTLFFQHFHHNLLERDIGNWVIPSLSHSIYSYLYHSNCRAEPPAHRKVPYQLPTDGKYSASCHPNRGFWNCNPPFPS